MPMAHQTVDPFRPRPQTMPGQRRLRHQALSDADRNLALGIHLSPFAAFFFPLLIFAPLVIWLIRRGESVFVDDHGRETLNFLISFCVWHVVLILTVIGTLLIPVIWIVGIVNIIRGAVAASNGEYFRYPMTFRFIA